MADNNNENIPGKVIEGHAYDGIQELDNPLPRWWLQIFYGTIVFAVIYYAYYQLMGGPTLRDELAEDLKAREELVASQKSSEPAGGGTDIESVTATDEQLAKGKEEFVGKCAACHTEDGGGSIGPNLTDVYWLHGDGSKKAIMEVVSKGVLDKGMPGWEQVLSPQDLQSVVLYVSTLKGTTPKAPKEPQGEAK